MAGTPVYALIPSLVSKLVRALIGLILDANPLEDVRNSRKIRAVVRNGRYFSRQALDEMLTRAEEAARPR